MSRGSGHTGTNIPDVSQLQHLTRDQLVLLLSTVGIGVMMVDNLLVSHLMMVLGREGTFMILTTPVATPTPLAGRLPQTEIQGEGGRLIDGGEGFGGGDLNDRPGLRIFKVPYLRARLIGTANWARGS